MIENNDESQTFDIEEIARWFDSPEDVKAALEGCTITRAIYETGDYDGEWIVEWIDKDGHPGSNMGAHCSCNGPAW